MRKERADRRAGYDAVREEPGFISGFQLEVGVVYGEPRAGKRLLVQAPRIFGSRETVGFEEGREGFGREVASALVVKDLEEVAH